MAPNAVASIGPPSLQAAEPISAIQFENFHEIGSFADLANIHVAQTAEGSSKSQACYLRLPDLHMMRLYLSPPCIVHSELNPNFVHFIIPVRWRGDLKLNGESVRPTNFFRFCDADDLIGRGESREVLSVGIRRQELVETIAALRGVEPEDVTTGSGALALPRIALDRIRHRFAALLDSLIRDADCLSDPRATVEISESVKTTVIDYLLCATEDNSVSAHSWASAVRIVGRVEEYYAAANGKPLSLAELCQAAAVSASTVNAAFRSLTGLSPARYLKLRRFSDARSALLANPHQRSAVKFAALGVGLTDLGRFSIEYKALFGESPSATVSRTNALAPLAATAPRQSASRTARHTRAGLPEADRLAP